MEKGFYAFGTLNYIKINSEIPAALQNEILNTMQEMCESMDALWSAYRADSEIGQINQNAGLKPVKVSEATFNMLERALYFSRVSEGAFDPTIRPAVELWKIGKEDQKIPTRQERKEAAKLVSYKDLSLNKEKQIVFLNKKGQSIDLGGIAKGFAADCIRTELIQRGISSALLNFGGTILTIGGKEKKQPWKVGIQNPLLERGKSVGTVFLEDGIMVTSGVNERFFLSNGMRYHHILDPRTCDISRNGVLSVTAVGGTGMDLDAVTTALFVLGVEKGIKLVDKLGMEALYLTGQGEMIATKGFATGKYQLHRNQTIRRNYL